MEFPITDLLGDEQSERWLLEHFHPDGLKCPKCGAGVENSLKFRLARKSSLQVYRCRDCQAVYNFYTGTLFERRRFRPQQAVLLIRGVLKGEPANVTAAELELDYISVLQLRRATNCLNENLTFRMIVGSKKVLPLGLLQLEPKGTRHDQKR